VTRIERLLSTLRSVYGPLAAPPSNPFTLFVWETLSTHSTAAKRDKALAALKKLGALTPDSMGTAPRARLEAIVGAAGPYAEQRLRSLRKGVEIFRRSPDLLKTLQGPLPVALKTLKPLPQMSGDSGAYRMLLFAAGQPVLPVSARVERTARRLGYGVERARDFKGAAKGVRTALASELAQTADVYRTAYLYLAHHGETTCTSEPACESCPLLDDCPEGQDRMGPPA
jgi:endonuclease III